MARHKIHTIGAFQSDGVTQDVVSKVDSAPISSASDVELATRAILREARRARGDLSMFYSFTMRHETTQERLVAWPHQRLAFSFVEAHPLCVLRLPVGTGKTYMMAATALWLLGNDVTRRAAIVSKTQGQAAKPVGMVADYITEPNLATGLALVFPWLVRSPRAQDPWTQTQLTIERPAGIRDPSLMAYGLDTTTPGSRWSFFVADDLIDDENSMTPESREKVVSKFNGRLWSRLDPRDARGVCTNTPWNREDLTYYLENVAQWPTLTIDIYGYIRVTNASASWLQMALKTLLRPSRTRESDTERAWYRLRAHDPDPDEQIPLCPERYSAATISEIRYGKDGYGGMLPHEFARLFLCEPMDVASARCQREWIERCKRNGMGKSLVSVYAGPHPTYTGLDLGIGPKKKHDPTVFFTFARHPNGTREILDVESGRFSGLTIVDKIIDKCGRYGSAAMVEGNAAQDYIRQFALAKQKDLKVESQATTTANKHDKDFGVESIFSDFQNDAWIVPCDHNGMCHPEVQKFLDDCLYYQPPPAHTGNHLMAAWLGVESSRKRGGGNLKARAGRRREMVGVGAY